MAARTAWTCIDADTKLVPSWLVGISVSRRHAQSRRAAVHTRSANANDVHFPVTSMHLERKRGRIDEEDVTRGRGLFEGDRPAVRKSVFHVPVFALCAKLAMVRGMRRAAVRGCVQHERQVLWSGPVKKSAPRQKTKQTRRQLLYRCGR